MTTFEVIPARFYDNTDIGGGTGWNLPELHAKPERGMTLVVPMFDTDPRTVALAKEAAEKALCQRQPAPSV